ncbi:hypothetical protein [Microbispora sp. ATCC PTA-5024]|uniref:hypothetical protein n=1 Tax=Microbispora sp. ATCC PTA-5024 TaxID=316330 RepID=UPI0003DC7A8C|nr:hypothetical protein [Microbispora sp. ATCC PTA-5024]ETK35156.1 hypothetical protein MPTA5024_15765 [Microbispora sp. ATCC PTA-5024]
MRRSVRNILGLAAVTAAVAVGVPALSTAANASTASAASSHSSDYDDYWGPYWSWNHLAKAKGYIDVNYDDDESNAVHITGKLYDLDHRTYGQGGKCAYIKFRVSSWDDEEDDWSSSIKSYKYCGAGGYKAISFWRYDVAQVQAKVCQVGLYSNYPVKCGSWHDLYNAYDEDYGYEA